MKTKHIAIKNKRATYNEADGHIVCKNSSYEVEFDFDEEWSAYEAKKARFTIWRKGRYENIDIEFKGNVCPIPPVTNTPFIMIGVYVDDSICTTTPATIFCDPSILCGASKSVLNADEVSNINNAIKLWVEQNASTGAKPNVKIENGILYLR